MSAVRCSSCGARGGYPAGDFFWRYRSRATAAADIAKHDGGAARLWNQRAGEDAEREAIIEILYGQLDEDNGYGMGGGRVDGCIALVEARRKP